MRDRFAELAPARVVAEQAGDCGLGSPASSDAVLSPREAITDLSDAAVSVNGGEPSRLPLSSLGVLSGRKSARSRTRETARIWT